MTQPLVLPLDVRLMGWAANALLVVFVVLGLGSAGLWVARHPAWTVRGITVQGDVAHQNAVTFRAQLASRLSGSFLTLDLQQVKQLFEDVPWVRQAVVQRTFPNRLTVTLQEHQAVAWWGESGGTELVNQQGEVFEATPDEPAAEGWPELVGPPGQSQQVHALYLQLSPLFKPLDHEVQRLELNSRGSWKLKLDNGTQIELGRGDADELLRRAQTYASSVTQLTQRYSGRDVESADLRYPNGYAVRLRGVTTLAEKSTAKPTPR